MDLWTARDAPVARIKVEPQLHVNNDWVIYPMEARVMEATVPEGKLPAEAMGGYLCKRGEAVPPSNAIMSSLRFRNAQQDVALAATAPQDELQKVFGACDAPRSPDPEWYLHIRDYLLRPH